MDWSFYLSKIRRIGDVLCPDEAALEFGDIEIATWSEAEAVGGLNHSTRLELGLQTASPNLRGLPTFDGSATQLRVFKRFNLQPWVRIYIWTEGLPRRGYRSPGFQP